MGVHDGPEYALNAMMKFYVGSKVCFDSGKQDTQVGTLIKFNQKAVTVFTEDGRRRWKVSPQMLSPIVAEARSQANVIDLIIEDIAQRIACQLLRGMSAYFPAAYNKNWVNWEHVHILAHSDHRFWFNPIIGTGTCRSLILVLFDHFLLDFQNR